MSDNSNSLMSNLAPRLISTNAQKAVLNSGTTYDLQQLAKNPNLHPEVWNALASIKNDVVLTLNLTSYSQVLDENQLRLLAKDRRKEPVRSLLRNSLGQVSIDFGNELLASKLPIPKSEVAKIWLQYAKVPKDMLTTLVSIDPSRFILPYLLREDLFTDHQAAELLLKVKDLKLATLALWKLVDLRPALTPLLIGTDNIWILEALSGSRHIFDQSYFEKLLEFAENLSDIEKGSFNSWLILANLLANPNVAPALKLSARSRMYITTRIFRLVNNKVSPEGSFHGIVRGYDRQLTHSAVIFVTQPWEEKLGELNALFSPTTYMGGFFTQLRYPSLVPLLKSHRDAVTVNSPPKREVALPVKLQLNEIFLAENGSPKSHICQEFFLGEIEPRLDEVGQGAWEQFFALSTNWHGSLAELLEMALSLS